MNIIKQMNDKNNIKYKCTKQSPVFVPPPPPPDQAEEEQEEQEEQEEEREEEDEEDQAQDQAQEQPENQARNVEEDEEEEEEGEQQPVEPVPAFSIDTDVDKAVPYLAISNLFGMQGLVPVFELWSAIKSGHQAYRFVPNGEILLIASHATTYRYGLWMSSDHCQGGAPQQVYTLERLDIQYDPETVKTFVKRDNAAHKIQRAARSFSSSQKLKKTKPNGGKRNKHLKTARKTRRNRK